VNHKPFVDNALHGAFQRRGDWQPKLVHGRLDALNRERVVVGRYFGVLIA